MYPQDALSPEQKTQLYTQRLDNLLQQAQAANDEQAVYHLGKMKQFIGTDPMQTQGQMRLDYAEAVEALGARRNGEMKKDLPTSFERALSGKFEFKDDGTSLNAMFKDIGEKGSDSKHYTAPLDKFTPTAAAYAFGEDRTNALRKYHELRDSGQLAKMPYKEKQALAAMMAHQVRAQNNGLLGAIGDTLMGSIGELGETVATGSPFGLAGMPATGGLRGAMRGATEPFSQATPVMDGQGNLADIQTDVARTEGEVLDKVREKAVEGTITGAVEAFGGKLVGMGISKLGSKIPGPVGKFIGDISEEAATNPNLLTRAARGAAVSGIAGELAEEEIEPALQWAAKSVQAGEITEREAGIVENLARGAAGDQEALKQGIAGLVTVGVLAGPVDAAATAPVIKKAFAKDATTEDINTLVNLMPPAQLQELARARSRKQMQDATGEKYVGSEEHRKKVMAAAQAEIDRRKGDDDDPEAPTPGANWPVGPQGGPPIEASAELPESPQNAPKGSVVASEEEVGIAAMQAPTASGDPPTATEVDMAQMPNNAGVLPRYEPQQFEDKVAGTTIKPMRDAAIVIQQIAKDGGQAVMHLSPKQLKNLKADGALGVYFRKTGDIAINRDTPNQILYKVVTHEYGHKMDIESKEGSAVAASIINRMLDLDKIGSGVILDVIKDDKALQEEIFNFQQHYIPYAQEAQQAYQKSGAEQAADVISGFIFDPGLLQQMAPNAYDLVKSKMKTDPSFKQAYDSLANYYHSGQWHVDVIKDGMAYVEAGIKTSDEIQRRKKLSILKKRQAGNPSELWISDEFGLMRNLAIEAHKKERAAQGKPPLLSKKGLEHYFLGSKKAEAYQDQLFQDEGTINRISLGGERAQTTAARSVVAAHEAGVPMEAIGNYWMLLAQTTEGTRANESSFVSNDVRTDPEGARSLLDALENEIRRSHGQQALDALLAAVRDMRGFQQYTLDSAYELGYVPDELYNQLKGKVYSSQEDLSRKLFEGSDLYNMNAAVTGATSGTAVGDVVGDSLAKSLVLLKQALADFKRKSYVRLLERVDSEKAYAREWSREEIEQELRVIGQWYEEAGIDISTRQVDDKAKMDGISERLALEGRLFKVKDGESFKIYEAPQWFTDMMEKGRMEDRRALLWGMQFLGKMNNNKYISQLLLSVSPTFGINELYRTSIGSAAKIAFDISGSAAKEFSVSFVRDMSLVMSGQKSLREMIEYNEDAGLKPDAFRTEVIDMQGEATKGDGQLVRNMAGKSNSLADIHDPDKSHLGHVMMGGVVSRWGFVRASVEKPFQHLRAKATGRMEDRTKQELSSQKLDTMIDQGLLLTHATEIVAKNAALKALENSGMTREQAATYVQTEIGNPVFDKSPVSAMLSILSPFARAKTAGLSNLWTDLKFYKRRLLLKGAAFAIPMYGMAKIASGVFMHLTGFLLADDEDERQEMVKSFWYSYDNLPGWLFNGAVPLLFYGGKDEEGEHQWVAYRVPMSHEYAPAFIAAHRLQNIFMQETKPEGMGQGEYIKEQSLDVITEGLKTYGITALGPIHEAVTLPALMDNSVSGPVEGPYDTFQGKRVTDPEEIKEWYGRKVFGPLATFYNEAQRELAGEKKKGFARKPGIVGQYLFPGSYVIDPGEKTEADYAQENWDKDGRTPKSYFDSVGLSSEYKGSSKWARQTPQREEDALRKAYFNAYLAPLDRYRQLLRDYQIAPTEVHKTALEGELVASAKDAGKQLRVSSSLRTDDMDSRVKDSLVNDYLNVIKQQRNAHRKQVPRDIQRADKLVSIYEKALDKAGISPDINANRSELGAAMKRHEQYKGRMKHRIEKLVLQNHREN
ncbi:hypothetical protein [Bremerella sp. P1]|uniref:hypothetical protein n=1 Tax=Bremerella sp. P1 TaxID=3026424 RepID=UPI002367BFA6|nr:hypothetical protein [Bremerella sp. P1]WDI44765.1 hypothetical protein PSR63_12545 [Bremerella sp. P1]